MDFSKISEKLAKIFFSKISEETQNEQNFYFRHARR